MSVQLRDSVTVLAVALAAVLLLVGIMPTVSPAETTTDGDGSTKFTARNVSWRAPHNLTGIFGSRVQVTADQETSCSFHPRVEGYVEPHHTVLVGRRKGWGSALSGSFYARVEDPVRAHAAGAETPRQPPREGPYHWGRDSGVLLEAGEQYTYTVIAFGLEDRSHRPYEAPMVREISCDKPVEFSLEAGRDAVAFNLQSLEEAGVGATVMEGPRTVVVKHNASLRHRFDNQTVRTFATWWAWDVDSQGNLTLDHPEGRSRMPMTPTSWNRQIHHTGGSGNYSLGLSMQAQGRGDVSLHGVLVGMDPVESLDDAI